MRTSHVAASVLALVALGGCGPSAEPATSETTPARPTEISGPPEPWAEMSFDERKRYMGREVIPVMTELFKEYDPGEFSGFSCDTCHGDDMDERRFAMPSPSLPALHPTGSAEQQQMVEEHPEMVRFMFNQVLPSMQRLLGAEPFDPETRTGFSCFACHPTAQPGDDPLED